MDSVVHVVDDDAWVRRALRMSLEGAGHNCLVYSNARSFLEAFEASTHSCIVTDVRMPDMSGVELMVELQKRGLSVPVIVMTAYADVPLAIQVMREGAIDLIEKPFNNETLLASVDVALGKARANQREMLDRLSVRHRLEQLTTREREVLAGLLRGAPNKIIAHELGIGMRTIETHRATVMEKMQADSLSELVRMCVFAERDGLIQNREEPCSSENKR